MGGVSGEPGGGQPGIMDAPAESVDGLIVLRQLPVIEERLAALAGRIEADIAEALALEVTEESAKRAKALRAGLNKDFLALEVARKRVKKEVMAPYEAFEAAYERLAAGKYKTALAAIDARVNEIEDAQKQRKRGELKDYYDELRAAAGIDFAPFERWDPKVGLSSSLKQLKQQAGAFISNIADCIHAIEGMDGAEEILVEYRRGLDFAGAVRAVESRRAAVDEEKRRQAMAADRKRAEAEALAKVDAALAEQAEALAPPKTAPAAEKDPDEWLRITYELRRRDVRRAAELFKESGIAPQNIRWEALPHGK